jgi:RNA polymerase sigma factor (TIGR02999 family)
MLANSPPDVTVLLIAWRNGNEQAGQELMTAVYEQLRRLARACLRDERYPATLQPTVLVNELYLAMFSRQPVNCENRLHFLNVAAIQMRHLIIDHARRHKNLRRGGDVPKLALDEARHHAISIDDRMSDLDEALERLEKMDARAAKIVELRFFGGLTEQEVASLLDLSVPTVKRDWEFARSWLLAQLKPD